MLRRTFSYAVLTALLAVAAVAPATVRAGVLDHFWESGPPTLTDVARMIDHIQGAILNQGTVVVKQPDVWSQARMTKFRKEFEDTMFTELNQFTNYLSARIARSDTASLQSQTALGASLTPLTPGSNIQLPFAAGTAGAADIQSERTNAIGLVVKDAKQSLIDPITKDNTATSNFSLLSATTAVAGDKTLATSLPPLGLEPNVHLDEKADYLTHLHRIRRVNLGDDNSDSAGYGLYLMRVPVSIEPGDKTKKGHGAIVNLTMRHDFGPRFLPLTYRNLVINDLVDILGPNVYELIRSGKAEEYHRSVTNFLQGNQSGDVRTASPELIRNLRTTSVYQPVSRTGGRTFAIAPTDVKRVFVEQNLLNLAYEAQEALDLGHPDRANHDTNKIRATDVRSFLRHELEAAYDLMEGRCRDQQQALLDDVAFIENLTDQVYCRKYEGPKGVPVDSAEERNEFYNLYESFAHRLPGNLRFRSVGILSWGIAVEAGLLNRQLQEDMKQVKGADGYVAPPEVGAMQFYVINPAPEVVTAFQEYIKARWPMITFALEPVTDQQNIEDSFTRRRDLQLAVAFALSSGRISFRQAIQFTRQLQYEAQTIALNQTVSSFAHGNDTFGWRFTPRFQTPPEESNMRAVTNLLLRGGPGPNYGPKNSKIEPGMRELTAVVVMPSFLHGMRVDVSSDWFRLHDPDERKLHTARTIELGRRINEARAALDAACQCGLYRPEDTERLRVRLHQLEVMLPLQTQFVRVPYENTLGGFALFTQGATALVPELVGYEGVEYLDTSRPTDLLVYGKHFSIYENAVVVGGQTLFREGTNTLVVPGGTGGNPALVPTTVAPLVDPATNNVTVVGSDGKTTTTVKNIGTFDILSREVMRIRIPAGVYTARREDGTEVVELYVSTPNGISNRLQIPVRPRPRPGTAPTAGQAFTFLGGNNLIVRVAATLSGTNGAAVVYNKPLPFAPGTLVQIQATGDHPLPPSISLQVAFTLTTPAGGVTQQIPINDIPLNGNIYTAGPDQLDPFAQQLFNLFKGNSLNFVELNSRSIQVLPAPPAGSAGPAPGPAPMTNGLNVKFETVVSPIPPAGGASAAPAAPAPGSPAKALASAGDRTFDPMTRQTSTAAPKPAAGKAVFADTPAEAPTALAQRSPGFLLPPLPGLVEQVPTTPPTALPIPAADALLPTLPGMTITPTPGTSGFTISTAAPAPASTTATTPAPARAPAAPVVAGPSSTVVVVPQAPARSPSINIAVPVTNNMPAKHRGLFHRPQAGNAPQPTRGPLLERLRGRP